MAHKPVAAGLAYLLIWYAGVVVSQEPKVHVSEHSTVVSGWSAKLIERMHGPQESDAVLVDLFLQEAGGARRLLAKNLVGPFIPLVRSRRVFACESNAAMETKQPLLIDLRAAQHMVAKHPGYLRDCTRVGSDEEIMLHYNLTENAAPYNLVRIIGSDGRILIDRRLNTEGDVEFEVSGKRYRVHVPAPEFPG